MGNYVSCALSAAAAGSHSPRCAKVILPGGELRWIGGAANAAELMLDQPGHFLVDSRSMHVGRRLAPLPADEALEMGVAYVMLPMKRATSAATAADMAALLVAVNKEVRRATSGRARVLPEESEAAEDYAKQSVKLEELLRQEKMEEVEEIAAEFKFRSSVCRSRRPTLETIPEEAIGSR